MTEDYQTAPWAREIGALWFSGFIDRCNEQVLHNLNIQVPSNTSSANQEQQASTENGELVRNLMEQDYAALHNAVLSHFLSTGETLPIFKWQELVQWRLSSSIDTLWPILQRFAYGHSTTAPAQPKPTALGTLLHFKPPQGSKLDPHTYPRDSIDASFAALGPLQPLAWYNLVVLHTARNHYRTALKICDELLELVFPPLSELHHALTVKIGLLYLFLAVKLNFSTHPKLTTVVTDMEKVIAFRITHTLGAEHLACLEQNVWFYILRAQLSMILLKIKSSKREISAMMSAYSKWQQEKLNVGSTADGETVVSRPSSSSPGSATDFTAEPINCAIHFVKSRLLDLRSNQDKAESDLKSASVISISAAPFYNSLGVLAFHKRKFAVSSLYFLKASQENQKLRQSTWPQVLADSRKSLPESVPDISTDVTYNMGLQMLLLGQFESAMRCFEEVQDRIAAGGSASCSPALLQLRLAEAQLAVYCAKVSEFAESGLTHAAQPSESDASTSSESSTTAKSTTKSVTKTASEVLREGGWLKLPRISGIKKDPLLESALQCATTAFLLFERFGKSGVPAPTSFGSRGAVGIGAIAAAAAASHSAQFSLLDRAQLTHRDYLLRVYVQVMLAWMSLESDNLTKALEWATGARQAHSELESALHSTGASTALNDGTTSFTTSEKAEFDHYYFLAHLYHAEAELRLGNVAGALTVLEATPAHLAKYPLVPATQSPYSPILDASVASSNARPAMTNASSSVSSATLPAAGTAAISIVPPKVALLCNMAAVWIVKKDLAQAQKLVSQALTQVPHLLPAISLQIYLELAAGNTEVAVRLMCDYRVHDLVCVR